MSARTASSLQIAGHLLLAIGVSGLLLALLIQAGLSDEAAQVFPRLLNILRSVSVPLLAVYVATSLLRTALQTWRYQLILRSSEPQVPDFLHIFLVTTSRNMFIDMLPSRLGELSYVAMLNRGHKVPVSSCLSSLALAFLFDLAALAVVIAFLAVYQLFLLELQWWLFLTALMVLLVFFAGLFLLFPGLNTFSSWAGKFLSKLQWAPGKRLAGKVTTLLDDLVRSLRYAREAGIARRLLLSSLGVRLAKYLGLYCLFYAVAVPHFPEVDTAMPSALMALISAEASASLPLPTFMGFGSYEAGGMLTMVALGASRSASMLIMLSLHLLSQAVDYLLGGAAFIAFMIMTMTEHKTLSTATVSSQKWRMPWYALAGLGLCAAAALFLLKEAREFRMRQTLVPPTEFGQALPPAGGEAQALAQTLQGRSGFIVWSSNRSGNHDLWQLSFPQGTLRQLTTNPHAEYFPRVSPDGNQLVFARSKEQWTSQRNFLGWDVYLLDLTTGRERLLAQDGNAPTWSADGTRVLFQRQGRQFVEFNLASGKEQVLLESGKNLDVPADTWLETASLSPDGSKVAVTFRGARRNTAVLGLDGSIRLTGNGCQLAWAPDGGYLFKVDHGGKQQNAIYRLDPQTLTAAKWLDAPGEFSHEYFPRIANTGDLLVYGASSGGHEHDKADYEIFLWQIGQPPETAVRLTHHSGNDNWPDIYLYPAQP